MTAKTATKTEGRLPAVAAPTSSDVAELDVFYQGLDISNDWTSNYAQTRMGTPLRTYHDPSYPWPKLDPTLLCDLAVFFTGNPAKFDKKKFDQGLLFHEPDQPPPSNGRAGVYVKALKPNGKYQQIPHPPDGNDPDYPSKVRKAIQDGSHIFFNQATNRSLFCLRYNCYAKAMTPELVDKYPQHKNAVGSNYCSVAHRVYAEPSATALGTFAVTITDSAQTARKLVLG